MRNPKRIDAILDRIRDEWNKNPDLRLHQLLMIMGIESKLDVLSDQEILDKLKLKETEY